MKFILILNALAAVQAQVNLPCDSTITTLEWGPNNWKKFIEDNPNPANDVTTGVKFTDNGATTVNSVSPTGKDWGFTGVDSLYDTNSNVATVSPSSFVALRALGAGNTGYIDFKRIYDIEEDAELWDKASQDVT